MIENQKSYYPPMHTAEHILNQVMVRMFGVERSFSNHIERKKSKCDYHFNRDLSPAEILKINKQVNDIIMMHLPVDEEILTQDEALAKYGIRKSLEDSASIIRIIKIGDFDYCACSGNHVKNTSEIGDFVLNTSSYENEVLRLRFKLNNTPPNMY